MDREVKAGRKLQHIYETLFMVVGFASAFHWEGPVEVKILLLLILTRVCFSWGEAFSLEQQVKELKIDLLRSLAVQQALIVGNHFESKNSNENEVESNVFANTESIRYLKTIRRAESAFNEELEKSEKMDGILDGGEVSITPILVGLGGQLLFVAGVGWGIAYAIAQFE